MSISAYLLLLFFASIASAALAAVLTYTGIKGEPPPIVTDAGEIPAAIVRRLHDGLQSPDQLRTGGRVRCRSRWQLYRKPKRREPTGGA